jgi:asparaginyl-tRNA synthetase
MLEAEFLADQLQDLTSNLASLVRFVVNELRKGDILTELITTLPNFEAHRESEIISRWDNLGQSKWTEMSYDEAIKLLIPQHEITPFDIAPVAGKPLQSEHEQFLASMFSTPVFVTHYPATIKPFYMKKSEDQVSVNNFDLIVQEMGEIAGGGLRLDDLDELKAIMDEKRMDRFELKWYRDLRRWGSVPHGGYGLGFDRFIAYLAGVDNVREIVAFPRFYGTSGCQN